MVMNRKSIGMISAAVMVMIAALAAVGLVAAQEATPSAESNGGAFLGVVIGETEDGVIVNEVTPDGPAAQAGIQRQDIILSFNGEPVTAETLVAAIEASAPGDIVTVEVQRGEETVSLEVTLGQRPADLSAPGREFDFSLQLGDAEIQYLPEEGVLVVRTLGEDSALAEAGLQEGDRITAINGEPIGRGVFRMVIPEARENGTVTLTVDRNGETLDLDVPLEAGLGLFMQGVPGMRGMNPGDMIPMPGMPDFEFDGRSFGFDFAGSGRLGVAFVTLDEQSAAENNVEVTEGALVTQVEAGSPAEAAGLQVNDIITAVNGEVVDAERTLADRIRMYEPDDVVTLDVLRGGESLQIEVTLGQPEMQAFGFGPGMRGDFGRPGRGNQDGRPFGNGQGMPPLPQPPTPPQPGTGTL
ncbi:MAG: PDZ domain-containing protein [bacterium]|nr:PDZ domain-containing protein [bacterium]